VAAADVGDPGALLELCDDAVERGQPRVDEVGVVAGAEEALAALVDVMVVLVPAEAAPVRAASVIRGESSTEPSAFWNSPGRYAGLSSSQNATACSGGRL
jgi:hypothetical protein